MAETGNDFPESFNSQILDSGFRRSDDSLDFDAIALSERPFSERFLGVVL